MRKDLAGGDAHIIYNTDLLASRIDDGNAEHLGQIVHTAPSLTRSYMYRGTRPRSDGKGRTQGQQLLCGRGLDFTIGLSLDPVYRYMRSRGLPGRRISNKKDGCSTNVRNRPLL